MIIFRTHSLTDLLEHQIWIEIHLFIRVNVLKPKTQSTVQMKCLWIAKRLGKREPMGKQEPDDCVREWEKDSDGENRCINVQYVHTHSANMSFL